ncbi:MAG: hypothetical protein AAF958_03120 [Planctomycetota bacterium]
MPREFYRGQAYVHWSQAIEDRRVGWLGPTFYYRFRELLAHATFRYAFACPIYCLMPDHFHMLWFGVLDESDQIPAIKWFRKQVNDSLKKIGFELQSQAYDHVLQGEERQETAVTAVGEYIARNPERAGLVDVDQFASYAYSGCVIPGYPEVRPFEPDYWDRFWRTYSHLRKTRMLRDEL